MTTWVACPIKLIFCLSYSGNKWYCYQLLIQYYLFNDTSFHIYIYILCVSVYSNIRLFQHSAMILQHTNLTNSKMPLFHFPQYTIQNRNVHITVLNGALWDLGQVHCGICEIGLLLWCLNAATRDTLVSMIPIYFLVQNDLDTEISHDDNSPQSIFLYQFLINFKCTYSLIHKYKTVSWFLSW